MQWYDDRSAAELYVQKSKVMRLFGHSMAQDLASVLLSVHSPAGRCIVQ